MAANWLPTSCSAAWSLSILVGKEEEQGWLTPLDFYFYHPLLIGNYNIPVTHLLRFPTTTRCLLLLMRSHECLVNGAIVNSWCMMHRLTIEPNMPQRNSTTAYNCTPTQVLFALFARHSDSTQAVWQGTFPVWPRRALGKNSLNSVEGRTIMTGGFINAGKSL